MGLTARKTGGNFERNLIPAGMHPAICYSVIDLWTQEIEWQWEKKQQRKVMITFELYKQLKEFDWIQKPLVKWIKFTLAFSDKSNLYKQLKSWLNDEPWQEFDLFNLLWKKATLQIIHSKWTDWNTYDNIQNILPSMDENEVKTFNKLIKFSFDEFKEDDFIDLYDWQKEIIIKSPEYQRIIDWNDETLPF